LPYKLGPRRSSGELNVAAMESSAAAYPPSSVRTSTTSAAAKYRPGGGENGTAWRTLAFGCSAARSAMPSVVSRAW
jgi:hypothetical protein